MPRRLPVALPAQRDSWDEDVVVRATVARPSRWSLARPLGHVEVTETRLVFRSGSERMDVFFDTIQGVETDGPVLVVDHCGPQTGHRPMRTRVRIDAGLAFIVAEQVSLRAGLVS